MKVAAAVLAAIVIVVIVAGTLVRSYTRAAFANEQRATGARALAYDALQYQLDEETAVRGYAATHNDAFLDPYAAATSALPATLRALRDAAAALKLPVAADAASDAAATNSAWLQDVVQPLLARRTDALPIEKRGKDLVDHYRADMRTVQDAVSARKQALDEATETAIDRLNGFVLLVAIAIVALGIAFGVQQTRLANDLAAKEREAAQLAAAYETEKRLAETLQDAFVQRPLPVLPAVSFSATYVPATEEAKVGGDWYDALELGRDRVMFVIGDVAGHGLEAAVAMNRARQALVTAAIVDPDPARLLARVNRELLHQRVRMVTAVCGYADARTFEFTYATAGHPPPVLVEPGRPPRMLHVGGLPLAVVDDPEYVTHTVQSVPGAMLVLYTDGAVEHSRDVLAGEETLLAAIRSASDARAGNPAAAIHSTIFDQHAVGDDVAIMTVAFVSGAHAGGEGDAAIVAAGARGAPDGVRGTIVSLGDAVSRLRERAARRRGRLAS
ncbi:MAG TPA: SpoIIE family protein phosphatase [Candidatus Baltobacteraceae bacterium]|nr:SpoIIE family protein phosphatase [Candidatus Baltobacteraceae bacterium]